MDPFDPTLDLRKHRGAQSLVDCHVFAKHEHIARLESQLPGERGSSLTLHGVAGDESLPTAALTQAQCIVLEVDPRDRQSLSRMEYVRRARPSMPIIAAIENADFNLTRVLVRQGVFDVVTLPFDGEELLSRVMDVGATLAAASAAPMAPMAAVVGSVAGIGATTVVTHLAGALSRQAGGRSRCCIVDLDLQFGQVAGYFGVEAAMSVLDLLDAADRLDQDLVRNAAVDTGRGPFVLAAPAAIAPLEQVDVDDVLRLLDVARRTFDFVLIDLPANWTNWTLSAVVSASDLLVLTDQSINGLRHAKRCLDLFRSVELSPDEIRIVINRNEKRLLQHIGLDDVEHTLGLPVGATLAREKNGLADAQDRGLLLNEVVRKARFSSDIEGLAGDLLSGGVHG
jgi:pilus assembly protein CpaE